MQQISSFLMTTPSPDAGRDYGDELPENLVRPLVGIAEVKVSTVGAAKATFAHVLERPKPIEVGFHGPKTMEEEVMEARGGDIAQPRPVFVIKTPSENFEGSEWATAIKKGEHRASE